MKQTHILKFELIDITLYIINDLMLLVFISNNHFDKRKLLIKIFLKFTEIISNKWKILVRKDF